MHDPTQIVSDTTKAADKLVSAIYFATVIISGVLFVIWLSLLDLIRVLNK